jgi:predicted RNase H-like HicB family nuclease
MNKYSINVAWSNEDNCYVALVPEFPNLSAFGETAGEAIKEAEIALKGFIDIYEEEGLDLPDPKVLLSNSGQTRIRMPKDLHGALSKEAERQGVSLNNYMVYLLSERNVSARVEERLTHIENRLKTLDSQVCNLRFLGVSESKPESNPVNFFKFAAGQETDQSNCRTH